jgi:hypothetical protein
MERLRDMSEPGGNSCTGGRPRGPVHGGRYLANVGHPDGRTLHALQMLFADSTVSGFASTLWQPPGCALPGRYSMLETHLLDEVPATSLAGSGVL